LLNLSTHRSTYHRSPTQPPTPLSLSRWSPLTPVTLPASSPSHPPRSTLHRSTQKYPQAQITMLSNSSTQKEHIEAVCERKKFGNVQVSGRLLDPARRGWKGGYQSRSPLRRGHSKWGRGVRGVRAGAGQTGRREDVR
jgi:hypothetical protein